MFYSLCEASSSEVLEDVVEIPGSTINSALRGCMERSVPGLGWQRFPGFIAEV